MSGYVDRRLEGLLALLGGQWFWTDSRDAITFAPFTAYRVEVSVDGPALVIDFPDFVTSDRTQMRLTSWTYGTAEIMASQVAALARVSRVFQGPQE